MCVSGCRESHAAQPACEPAVSQGAPRHPPAPKPRLQKPQSVAVPACFVLLAQVSARLVSVTKAGPYLGCVLGSKAELQLAVMVCRDLCPLGA